MPPSEKKERSSKACDSCHERKAKCNGQSLCQRCMSMGILCSYNRPRRPIACENCRQGRKKCDGNSPSCTEKWKYTGTPGLVQTCLDKVSFTNTYPVQPILDCEYIRNAATKPRNNEEYCMSVSLCAYVMIRVGLVLGPGPRVLLAEAIRVRQEMFEHHTELTYIGVITSYLLYGCNIALGKKDEAYANLQQAMVHAQRLRMHEEETYEGDPSDIYIRRFLYWLLVVSDRMYALRNLRPITLPATVHLPAMNPAEDDHCIGEGFHLLFKLYGSITMSGDHSQAYVAQTHLSRTLPIHLEPTRIQAVDLQVTQHWLAIMTWRSCNRNDFITVGMSDTAYPISISQNLLSISNQWSREKAKGSWVTDKLYDIACSLIDVIHFQSEFITDPSTTITGVIPRLLVLIQNLDDSQDQNLLSDLVTQVTEKLPSISLSALYRSNEQNSTTPL